MANTWGELSWSAGSWGEQNDISISLIGQQVSCAYNNVGVSTEINEGWGRLTWGENAWGIGGDVLVTGIGLSTEINTGSVKIDVGPALSGQQLSLNLNSITALGLAEVFPLGFNLSSNVGTVDPGPDVVLTGIGLTSSTGTLDAYNTTGWGRLTFGSEVWGASGFWATAELTGIQLSANLGTAVLDAVSFINVTGQQLTIEEGIVDPSPDATVVGIGLSAAVAIGSVVQGNANIDVTGISMSINLGTAVLDAVTIAEPTGQQLNIALNNVVAGASAEVDLTGNALTVGLRSINVQSWQIVDTGSSVNWNIIDTAA